MAGLLLVAFVAIVLLSPRGSGVSDKCRQAVSTGSVDGWRYIQTLCTDAEQQSLLTEFRGRGLSTEDIERSRREAGKR
ncbi:hypothetical protein [Novosphingobium resinovorum]|uniref:hypothetical protein n=1 Tax=Novosphingobium resinovorum TaxID=158500 RepID=UPI0012E9DC14|nr:hypothetical protein [Novosphingobium resinovorum]